MEKKEPVAEEAKVQETGKSDLELLNDIWYTIGLKDSALNHLKSNYSKIEKEKEELTKKAEELYKKLSE